MVDVVVDYYSMRTMWSPMNNDFRFQGLTRVLLPMSKKSPILFLTEVLSRPYPDTNLRTNAYSVPSMCQALLKQMRRISFKKYSRNSSLKCPWTNKPKVQCQFVCYFLHCQPSVFFTKKQWEIPCLVCFHVWWRTIFQHLDSWPKN